MGSCLNALTCISRIPTVIVHGRYDVCTPLRNAWEICISRCRRPICAWCPMRGTPRRNRELSTNWSLQPTASEFWSESESGADIPRTEAAGFRPEHAVFREFGQMSYRALPVHVSATGSPVHHHRPGYPCTSEHEGTRRETRNWRRVRKLPGTSGSWADPVPVSKTANEELTEVNGESNPQRRSSLGPSTTKHRGCRSGRCRNQVPVRVQGCIDLIPGCDVMPRANGRGLRLVPDRTARHLFADSSFLREMVFLTWSLISPSVANHTPPRSRICSIISTIILTLGIRPDRNGMPYAYPETAILPHGHQIRRDTLSSHLPELRIGISKPRSAQCMKCGQSSAVTYSWNLDNAPLAALQDIGNVVAHQGTVVFESRIRPAVRVSARRNHSRAHAIP